MTADKKRDTLLLNLERLSKWHEHECLVADDQKAGFHHNAAASFITAAIQRIEATSSPSATGAQCTSMEDCTSRDACGIAGRCLAAAPAPAQGEPASTTCPNCYGDGPHAECPLCKGSGYVTAPTAPVVEAEATTIANLKAALDAKQAKIDALMLEFCPGEMSEAQIAEWARHQKAVPDAPCMKPSEGAE